MDVVFSYFLDQSGIILVAQQRSVRNLVSYASYQRCWSALRVSDMPMSDGTFALHLRNVSRPSRIAH